MGKKEKYNRIAGTALTLILSVVMTITFMPAWAFAAAVEADDQDQTTATVAGSDLQAGDEDINTVAEGASQNIQVSDPAEDAGEDIDGEESQEEVGTSKEEGADETETVLEAANSSASSSGLAEKGGQTMLYSPEAKGADNTGGTPDDKGDETDDFPWYEYSMETGNRIYADGDAVLELDLPDGKDLPEYAKISQLRVGVAVPGNPYPEWVVDFADDDNTEAFTFDENTLAITIHGDNEAVRQLLEYHRIDLFIETSDESGNIAWAAGGSFEYQEPRYDFHMDKDRNLLVNWDGDIDKNNTVFIENTEHPQGEEFEYEVVSAVSSNPEVVTVGDDGDRYYYRAVSEGDAVITMTCSADGITLPDDGNVELKIHVGDHVYSADIWSVNGSYNSLPGGAIDLAGYAEDEYKAKNPDNNDEYDTSEPIDGSRFIWTVEDGNDVVDEIIQSDDGKVATVRFKPYDEIAGSMDNDNGRWVQISLKVEDEGNVLVYRDTWLRVSNCYAEINPTEDLAALTDMNVGESREIILKVIEYTASGTGNESREIQDAEFNWEYDDNCAEITGDGNRFTVIRKGDWSGFLKVRAEWGDGDRQGETEYQTDFKRKNYDIWFDMDDNPLFTDGDKTLTLNTDNLEAAGIDDPLIRFEVRREKENWTTEEDKWETIENPDLGKPLYTVNGKEITLHGAELYDVLGRDENINIVARARLNSEAEYELAERDEWVFVRDTWIDWERENDRNMLPGWNDNIRNSYWVELENSQYPDREHGEYRVAGVEVVSGAEFLEDDCLDNNGNLKRRTDDNDESNYWWDYKIKNPEDIDDLSDAKVTFKVLLEDNEWGIEDYEFNIYIGKDVFDVNIESKDEKYNGLPGSEFELTARGRHEYLDDRNEYQKDNIGLGYGWSLDENCSDFAEIIPNGTDPSKATLRFKNLPDGEDSINEDVRVKVKLIYNGKEVSENERNFRVMSCYEEICPTEIDRRLDKGSGTDISLELRRYDIEYNSVDRYKVIADAEFEFEYDNNAISITDENGDEKDNGERYPAGQYTITKKENWWTDLKIRAFWKDGNEERDIESNYDFDEIDYNLEFEYDGGDVYTDGDTEIRLNTDRLGDDWAERYDISFIVGKGEWQGEEEGYTWDYNFDNGTEYTVDSEKPSVTLIGDKLADSLGESILIVYQLKLKNSETVLSEDDYGVYIREPWLDSDMPEENEDFNLLRGWDYYINGRIGYSGGNSQNHEFWGEYIVQSVKYNSVEYENKASDDITQIEARPYTDDQGQSRIDWSIRVLDGAAPGSRSVVRLTYIDSEDESESPHERFFNINVVDDVYEVRIDSVDGKFQEFPGGSIELRAYGLHKFTRNNDDGEGWHYEESQEGLGYKWEFEDSSIANLTQNPGDASRATLKFKEDIPNDAGTRVTVKLIANDQEVAEGFDFFGVSTEFPEVQPATIPANLNIGETAEIGMKTVLKEKGGEDREIPGAEYVWFHNEDEVCIEAVGDDGEVSVIHNGETSSAKNIRITRLTGRYIRFSLRSEWGPRFKWHAYYLDPVECSIELDAPDNTDITMSGNETESFHFITRGLDSEGVEYEPLILVWNEDKQDFDRVEGLSAEDVTVSSAAGSLDVNVNGPALLEKNADRFNIQIFAKVKGREVWRCLSSQIHAHSWSEWTETPVTYDEPAKKTRECASCHETEVETTGKSLKQDADDKLAAAANAAQDAADAKAVAEQKLKDAAAAAATPGDAAVAAAQAAKAAADEAKKAAEAAKTAADEARAASEAAQAAAPDNKKDEAEALVTNAANLVTDAEGFVAAATTAITNAETAVTKANTDKAAKDKADAAAKAKAAEKAKAAAKAKAEKLARDGVLDKKIPKVKISKPSVKKKTITAKWKKLNKKQLKKSKAKKYEIWICPNKKFAKADTKEKIVSKSKSSFKFKGLKKKTKYYVKVRAIRYSGKTKYVGNWSKVKSIKTK